MILLCGFLLLVIPVVTTLIVHIAFVFVLLVLYIAVVLVLLSGVLFVVLDVILLVLEVLLFLVIVLCTVGLFVLLVIVFLVLLHLFDDDVQIFVLVPLFVNSLDYLALYFTDVLCDVVQLCP